MKRRMVMAMEIGVLALALGCTRLSVTVPNECEVSWRGGILVDPKSSVAVDRAWVSKDGRRNRLKVVVGVKETTQGQALVALELVRAAKELAAAAAAKAEASSVK